MSLIEPKNEDFYSGFVALIGRPNVGKSTLVNHMVGAKIAITSPVAQTTRNRLRAILTTSNAQLVLVDTPGIHKPHHLLGERLVRSARSVIGEVDAVLLLLEACHPPGRGDEYIVNILRQQKLPVLVALNKCDLISDENYQIRKSEYKKLLGHEPWPIFRCSAVTGQGCDDLIKSLIDEMPSGPRLYPSGMTSDQPQRFLLGELIREQVLLQTREEIPHSVAVTIDRLEELLPGKSKKKSKGHTAILATVLVERKSQKGILIGKRGSMLKSIGQSARAEMQKLINGAIYLELFVKVVPDWRSKPSRLSELGYEVNQ